MKANFKPINVDDETINRMQANIGQAFSNLGQVASLSVKTVTANYLVTADDDVVLCDPTRGAFTVSLPPIGILTKPVSLRTVGASTNVVTVAAPTPVTIDGATSLKLAAAPVRLVSNAQGWWSS